MSNFTFTDRYQALGIPYPNPKTICEGQCEGVGFYPTKDQTEPEWIESHAQDHEEPCDGWHFVKCRDCNGTGKRLLSPTTGA